MRHSLLRRKRKAMIKKLYLCLIVLIIASGCRVSRIEYEEKRNLMLLKNYELERNQRGHKPHHETKKFKKKMKKHLHYKK